MEDASLRAGSGDGARGKLVTSAVRGVLDKFQLYFFFLATGSTVTGCQIGT